VRAKNMNVALFQVRERASRPREHLIASRLQRFAWRHREAVSELAYSHSRLADLALSFPALLFALAVPRRRFDPNPVIERIIQGASLRELAALARIPLWTRKLPPEAFLQPLPLTLPDSDLFRRQVGNHLPRWPSYAHKWLSCVSQVSTWGTDHLALWFAAKIGRPTGDQACAEWRLLCLWAWHCEHPEAPAARFLRARWTPAMSVIEAIRAAMDWSRSVGVAVHLADEPIADMWAETAGVDGYEFVPVRTASELIEHAYSMNNCARDTADEIGINRSRVWVIRKAGHYISMLELFMIYRRPAPQLRQIHGSSNSKVSKDQWLAALRWHREYGDHRARPHREHNSNAQPNWMAMWRPYWLAKGRIPAWLPLSQQRAHWPLPSERNRRR
jgi:hypothetical protein